jgi:nicotinamidase-related amidase
MPDALIVVDMLNSYDHPDAEPLKESVANVVPVIAALVKRARDAGVTTVYVNDCHEDWSAHRSDIAASALAGTAPELVAPLIPADDMPFIIKARHSIFYGTSLEYMLRQEKISRLVLTGQVTEQCILYSALDAYVRRFELAVVRDGVAHIDSTLADAALEMMDRNMSAHVVYGDDALRPASGAGEH